MDELSIAIFLKKLRMLMSRRASAGRIPKRRYGASFGVLYGSACTCMRMSFIYNHNDIWLFRLYDKEDMTVLIIG